MDQFYGRGFQYNINNALNEEFFDYGNQRNPIYRLMNEPEIPVERPQDHYRNDYPQQMHQIYHDDVSYGNDDGYHSPRHGSNYPYAQQRTPFDYRQETEYPSNQISVNIRMSRWGVIDNHFTIGLQHEGLSCEVRGSVDITVSGYPAHDGADGFLALVKQISGDRGASIVD